MKAIIQGNRYDTERATLIGEAGSDCGHGDFKFWEAGLYVTPRSGKYFIAGRGGVMSRFAVSHGNGSYSGGEAILPMDRATAFEWAQSELTTAEVEAAFGDMIQDA